MGNKCVSFVKRGNNRGTAKSSFVHLEISLDR